MKSQYNYFQTNHGTLLDSYLICSWSRRKPRAFFLGVMDFLALIVLHFAVMKEDVKVDGHRAPIIAFIGFLALFIIHWAAAPGAAERAPQTGSRTCRTDDAASESWAVVQYGQACPGMNEDAYPFSAVPFFGHAPAERKHPGWNDDALPEAPVPTGKDDLFIDLRQEGVLSPGSMTLGPVGETGRTGRGLLASGRIPATTKGPSRR